MTKRINYDENCSYEFDFVTQSNYQRSLTHIKHGSYIAATYDNSWYIGVVEEIDTEHEDLKINFMHPKGPAASFHFPEHEDVCWIPCVHILCSIESPTLATARGQYHILPETAQQIMQARQIISN